MIVYIILIIISLFMIIMGLNKHIQILYKQLTILLVSIILLLLYVFRSLSVGTDYNAYYSYFTSFTYNQLRVRFIEPGYAYLNEISQNYGDFLIISFLVFLICFLGLNLLCKELKLNKCLWMAFFVLTYFYLFMTNGIRQFIALGFVCIGSYLFLRNYKHTILKYCLFLLFILIAKQFHATAIFCLLFILFPHMKFGGKTIIISGSLTTMLFFTNIMNNIFNKFLNLSPRYSIKYSESIRYSGTNAIGALGSKNFIKFVPVLIQFLFIYILVTHIKIHGYKLNFILSGYLFFLFMNSASGNIIATRLQIYLYIFTIFFSCTFMQYVHVRNIENSILLKGSFISFWVIYFIAKLLSNICSVVPYTFI